MVKRFFQSLAHRLYREQNLSDITWALAESDESFKQTFMDLFFKDFDAKKPHENKREFFKADSRPDILLRQDDLTYVIEVKINDKQNYHFKQYADAFKDEDARFGFISAYKLHSYELGKADREAARFFRIVTWQDFHDRLREGKKYRNKTEPAIIDGYCDYLKEVCDMVDIKKSAHGLEHACGINSLFKLIKWIVKNHVNTDTDGKIVNHDEDTWLGMYVDVKRRKNTFYPLIGLDFNDEAKYPSINIWIEKQYNEKLYSSILKRKETITRNKLFDFRIVDEDEYIEFKLPRQTFIKFNNASLEAQKKVLDDFLGTILNVIEKCST